MAAGAAAERTLRKEPVMSRSSIWRVVFVFLLVVVLAVPAVRAAEPRSGFEPVEGQEAALTSWHLLGQLWALLSRLWTENGCQVDPSGRCQPDPGPNSFTGDNGCQVDPDGRCIG